MTGPEHYHEAERLLLAYGQETFDPEISIEGNIARFAGGMAHAQVHATLALTAATAAGAPGTKTEQEWREAGALA